MVLLLLFGMGWGENQETNWSRRNRGIGTEAGRDSGSQSPGWGHLVPSGHWKQGGELRCHLPLEEPSIPGVTVAGDLSRILFDLVLIILKHPALSFLSWNWCLLSVTETSEPPLLLQSHSLSPCLPNLDPASLGYTW